MALCHTGLVKEYGSHPVNQTRSSFLKSVENNGRKSNKHSKENHQIESMVT